MPGPLPPSEGYFACAKPADIGKRLLAVVHAYYKDSRATEIINRQSKAWQFYYGFGANGGAHGTSQVLRAGAEGELADIHINHSRALVNTLKNLITAPKLVWQPKATNIDYESVTETELAATATEYYWQDRQIAALGEQAVEEGITLTEGYVFGPWEDTAGEVIVPPVRLADGKWSQPKMSGDFAHSTVSSWDVIRDPGASAWNPPRWVIIRRKENKYDLAERHPNLEAELLGEPLEEEPGAAGPFAKNDGTSDDIYVYYFFHRRTPALPMGRETIFTTNTVLKDVTLSYEDFPLYRVAPAEIIGRPFGYSAYMEILGLQELYDSLNSSAATNFTTFANQCIAVPEGQDAHVDEIAGGMRVFYYPNGGAIPTPLQLVKQPEQLFPYLDALQKQMELLMGLNAVVRGEAQSDRLSGSALALLQSQALQQSSSLQGSYLRMVERIGQGLISTLNRRASVQRKIQLTGKQQSFLVREVPYGKGSFGRIKRVTVEVGNPLSQTAAGRAELAKEWLQMGIIRTPDEYHQVLSTGRADPINHAQKAELINILSENEDLQIAKAGAAPRAMIQDNHMLHGKEHTAVVASPAARKNPAVVAAFTRHMHEHYSLFYGVPMLALEPPAPVDPVTGAPILGPNGQPLPPPPPQDPLYRERMMMLMGQQPPAPPMSPPGAPGAGTPGPNGPPGPPGHGPPPPKPGGAEPAAGRPPEHPNLPEHPQNPATGKKWNPTDGGGAVPPP